MEKVAFLRRNLSKCPQQTKVQAYTAMVRPHVEYASAVWDSHLKKDGKRVETIQRRAARFIKGESRREDGIVTQLLNDLDRPPLELRRKCHRIEIFLRIVAWQKHDFHRSSPEGAFKLQHKIIGNLHKPRYTYEERSTGTISS